MNRHTFTFATIFIALLRVISGSIGALLSVNLFTISLIFSGLLLLEHFHDLCFLFRGQVFDGAGKRKSESFKRKKALNLKFKSLSKILN